jgi:hypothetical protein
LNTNSLKKANFTSSVLFSSAGPSNLNSEAILLKEMFSLKQALDFKADHLSYLQKDKLLNTTDNAIYILDNYAANSDNFLSESISNLESSYL